MSTSYEKLPGLAGFYFEDSYVLDLTETPDTLSFAMDIVLTEDHPSYQPPPPDEAYCYRHGTLTSPGFREVEWLERSEASYTDVTGEVDHGNVAGAVPSDGVEPLARALVEAAAIENAAAALASQSNALNALSAAQPFDRAIVAPLLGLDRSRLDDSGREALDALAAYHRGG